MQRGATIRDPWDERSRLFQGNFLILRTWEWRKRNILCSVVPLILIFNWKFKVTNNPKSSKNMHSKWKSFRTKVAFWEALFLITHSVLFEKSIWPWNDRDDLPRGQYHFITYFTKVECSFERLTWPCDEIAYNQDVKHKATSNWRCILHAPKRTIVRIDWS